MERASGSRMRVLIVHNFYSDLSPSGENEVVRREVNLLAQAGYEVEVFSANNSLASGVNRIEALLAPWNPFSQRRIAETIRLFRPNVAHVHNLFPLLSASVVHELSRAHIPIVCTVHNYRFFCASGVAVLHGGGCDRCLTRNSVIPALLNRCYRSDLGATAVAAGAIFLNRKIGLFSEGMNAYFALSEFQRSLLIKAGCPQHKVFKKSNFSHRPSFPVVPIESRSREVVYAGRFSEEKNPLTLLRAWKLLGERAPLLTMFGDGPQFLEAEKLVLSLGLKAKVILRGRRSPDEVQRALAAAKLVVIPSLAYEGFPLVAAEAFSVGTPVLGSERGTLVELGKEIAMPCISDPLDADALGRSVTRALDDVRGSAAASNNALDYFERHLSPEACIAFLDEHYRRLVAETTRS